VLGGGESRFRGDDGPAEPQAAAALTAYGDPGSDLQVQVTITAGGTPGTASEVIRLLGTEVMARLGGRLRRGIAVAVVPR